MTTRIIYEGPVSLAVPTATKLADAEGLDLTSSDMGDRGEGGGDVVRLALVVEGPVEAVTGRGGRGSGRPAARRHGHHRRHRR